jgi:hypothetical protein
MGSIHYSGRIFKSLGFKYRKCNDGRKFLLERHNIAAARNVFLRKMHGFRQNSDPHPVVYVPKASVNQNHRKGNTWQDSPGNGGLKMPTGKGTRLIICHAESPSGFITHAKLVFQSPPPPPKKKVVITMTR